MTTHTLQPVQVPKAAQLVADAVRARILRGDLVPGDRLPSEAALTAQYGVSRPTLREALRLLEAQELLEMRRGARGGGVVRAPGTGPALEAIRLWLLLSRPAGTIGSAEPGRLAEVAAAALDFAASQPAPSKRRKAA
jgi:GntR family transcriptional repressor for pyruvate dehydrogenase complex